MLRRGDISSSCWLRQRYEQFSYSKSGDCDYEYLVAFCNMHDLPEIGSELFGTEIYCILRRKTTTVAEWVHTNFSCPKYRWTAGSVAERVHCSHWTFFSKNAFIQEYKNCMHCALSLCVFTIVLEIWNRPNIIITCYYRWCHSRTWIWSCHRATIGTQ